MFASKSSRLIEGHPHTTVRRKGREKWEIETKVDAIIKKRRAKTTKLTSVVRVGGGCCATEAWTPRFPFLFYFLQKIKTIRIFPSSTLCVCVCISKWLSNSTPPTAHPRTETHTRGTGSPPPGARFPISKGLIRKERKTFELASVPFLLTAFHWQPGVCSFRLASRE